MKKLIILFGILSIGIIACKKDDTPAAKQVVATTVTLENFNKNADNDLSKTWYSSIDGKAYTMADVKNNLSLSGKIDFGFNISFVITGFFSPASYPVQYGQDTWTTKNTTTFKILTEVQLVTVAKLMDENTLTVADIDQAYINATDPAPQFTESVNDGQMLTFQTAAGNRGIIRILEFDAVAKTAKIDVRFVK